MEFDGQGNAAESGCTKYTPAEAPRVAQIDAIADEDLIGGSSSPNDKGHAHTLPGTSTPVAEANIVDGSGNNCQERQLCCDKPHGEACPLLDIIEKLSGTIRNQKEAIKLKEQEASMAQRKVEEMTDVKDQQDMELIDLAQIAQNLQMRLRKREEELEVREREIENYKIHIRALRVEYEDLRQNYLRNCSNVSTHQQEPWKKKEAENLRRQKDVINQLSCANEELNKRIKNWRGNALYFEAEYKKLLRHGQVGALARQHEVEVVALREQVSKYEVQLRELLDRTQMAERIVAKHTRVDTALYQDDEATPALLQGMADAVKSSISMCASKIVRFADQHSLPIKFGDEHVDTIKGHNRKQVVKMAFQAILCEALFHSFESCTFSFPMSPSNVLFEKPEVRRKQRLKLFQELRHLEPVEIIDRSSEFALFVPEKWKLVLNKLAPGQDDISTLIDSSCPFYVSYLRLAKAVWLIHEVAFACEPASAEIFRVPPKSPFMEEYMTEHEDTQAKGEVLTKEEGEGEGGERCVALMNVPGFTLRNSVVKSVVCCFDSLVV